MQQITIFDAPDTSDSFAIGDTVKVVVNVSENEVEDLYYLKTYERARGEVVKVLHVQKYIDITFADIGDFVERSDGGYSIAVKPLDQMDTSIISEPQKNTLKYIRLRRVKNVIR